MVERHLQSKGNSYPLSPAVNNLYVTPVRSSAQSATSSTRHKDFKVDTNLVNVEDSVKNNVSVSKKKRSNVDQVDALLVKAPSDDYNVTKKSHIDGKKDNSD